MSVFTNPASAAPEHAAAYVAAILELLGDRRPDDVLRRTIASLTWTLDTVPGEQITGPEAEGKWSVRDVLQHLADSELVGMWRPAGVDDVHVRLEKTHG